MPIWLPELLDSPDAMSELDKIDPNWPQLEPATQMAPRLLGALTNPSYARRTAADGPRVAETMRCALDRIEPGWRAAHAARAPELTTVVLDVQKPQFDRARALRLLDEACPGRALDVAGSVAGDAAPAVPRTAIPILARSEDPRVIEPLLLAARVTESYPSALAIEALARFGDRRAVPVPCEALCDFARDKIGANYWFVQSAAAKALGRLNDPSAIEPLGRMLTPGTVRERVTFSPDVKGDVAQALAAIGGYRAAEILREVLSVPRNAFGGIIDRAHSAIVAALETVEKDLVSRAAT